MSEYSKKEIWELYQNLPTELQAALFSSENADRIYKVCLENNIKEEKIISDIAKEVGYVFLGLTPPNELEQVFKKDIGLKNKTAKNLVREITRFVFLPVRESLEALYKIKILEPKPTPSKKNLLLKNKKKQKKRDIYREPIE